MRQVRKYFGVAKMIWTSFISMLSLASRAAGKEKLDFCGRPMEYGRPLCFRPVVSSSFVFFFSSLNLRGRRLDVYHTSTHNVVLVQIWNACLKCATRLAEIQDAKNRPKFAIWAPSHNFVGLYLRN